MARIRNVEYGNIVEKEHKNVAGNKPVQMEYRQNTCILSNLQKSL